MRVVVCAREVLDPDAVSNYVLEGKLEIGEDGRSVVNASIPRLMNAYDEQALEAALRLKDNDESVTVDVVSLGSDSADILKHAAAMGADGIFHLAADPGDLDCSAIGRLLGAWVGNSGGAQLVLCGRQASDDDQGVVPAVLAEALSLPLVTIARDVAVAGEGWKVIRATPDGDETVQVDGGAVVTISNELGDPRYPTMSNKMKARRRTAETVEPSSLGLSAEELAPCVVMTSTSVPELHGQCEFIEGGSVDEQAAALVARLRQDEAIAGGSA